MIVVGFDPGKTGGWAAIEFDRDLEMQVLAGGMFPLVSAKSKEIIDPRALARAVRGGIDGVQPGDVAIVENVHSMPKMGAPSVFQFGRMFGGLETCIWSMFEKVEYIEPHRWKAKFGLVGGAKNKKVSRDTASRLLGQNAGAEFWPLQKHEGVAEAALIALYYIRHVHK